MIQGSGWELESRLESQSQHPRQEPFGHYPPPKADSLCPLLAVPFSLNREILPHSMMQSRTSVLALSRYNGYLDRRAMRDGCF